MNFAGLIGLLAAGAITAYAVIDSAQNPKVFADPHGIILVIGGTITVALISFNFNALIASLRIVFRKVLGHERTDYLGVIQQIIQLSEAYRKEPKSVKALLTPSTHPFLVDGMTYLVDYGFSLVELDEILSNALKGKKKRDEEEVKVWHTIARFPPAFGLLGATLGMIALLQTLGDPGAQDRIGPAMATALVATFYGLVVANLLLIPLAEKLANVATTDYVLRQIIKEGILMIYERKHPLFIGEYLKSFLAPKFRGDSSAPRAGQLGKVA
jgi:chemotaxis protein MotA